jgi:CubicO group peptidase (beta-lactamase class C family)
MGKSAAAAAGILIAIGASACGGQSVAAPTDRSQLTPVAATSEWPSSAPDNQRINAQSIRDLIGRISRNEYGPVSSLLIVRRGQLAVEEYFAGWAASRAHTIQSVTKSVTSVVTGIAIDQGKLTTADRAIDFFPGYQTIANLDDRKRAITVGDLLTMRTGFDWSESAYAGSPLQQLNDCRCDWLRFILDWPMREQPGTRWEYVSGGVILLGGIVGTAAGQRLDLFPALQLFGPLGFESVSWYQGLPDGLPHSGGGLNLRPRDMAKIGQLVLDAGRWRGTQIVSEAWIRESTQPRMTNVRSFGAYPADYGYLWWTLPRGVITASGAQGQWIFRRSRR